MTDQTTGTMADGNAERTTGTTTDGNAALSEQERQELEDLRRQKGQMLAEKSTLEALKAQAQSPPTNGTPAPDALLNQAMVDLELRARAGDQDAILALAQMSWTAQQVAQMRLESQLGQVPAERRTAVQQVMQERGVDVRTALDVLDATELRTRQRQVESRDEILRREERQRANGVLDVSTRPATVSETSTGQKMRQSEWLSAVESAKGRGDNREVMRLARLRDEGNLILGQ